jgi:uncharacterized membrane protein YdfJ with MMPL/SSD domain
MFPQGYYAEVMGEYAERQASSSRLLLAGGLALIGIFLLLLIDFGSPRAATLVFLTLPFALVGAIAAVLLTGRVLSLGSLVGLVTVIGIAARNGIMLVSHYRQAPTRSRHPRRVGHLDVDEPADRANALSQVRSSGCDGSVTVKMLPLAPLGSRMSVPPCASAIHRAIGRPSPAPA